MTEGLRLPLLAVAIALAPVTATAKVACIPPEETYPFEPGDLDPELRQIVNDQYEEYVRKIEDHINCLEAEPPRPCARPKRSSSGGSGTSGRRPRFDMTSGRTTSRQTSPSTEPTPSLVSLKCREGRISLKNSACFGV